MRTTSPWGPSSDSSDGGGGVPLSAPGAGGVGAAGFFATGAVAQSSSGAVLGGYGGGGVGGAADCSGSVSESLAFDEGGSAPPAAGVDALGAAGCAATAA